jgi:hypothetical protein
MGLAQMAGDPIVSGINNLFGTKYTLPTDAIEDLFTRIGVAEPKTEAERLVQTVASGAAQAGGTVALGQALMGGAGLSPTAKQLVGEALASGPLQQILGGAGSAAGAGIAAQQGAGPMAQLGAGLAGSALGSAAGNAMLMRPTPAQPIVAEADRAGINLMTSDVLPPQTAAGKFVQGASEKLPVVGTGPVRATQQTQRVTAVRNLLKEFGADDAAAASDDVMRDLLAKRSANFARWEGMKQEALQSVEAARPGATVPMTKTIKSIDDSIAYLNSLNNPDLAPAIQKLANAKQSFQNQSPVNVLKNKQILGDIFDAPEMGALKRTASSELKKTYDAVRDDLTDFIGEAGGAQARNKWGIANAEETKLFKELELGILETTLEKGMTQPEAARSMLFSKDRSVIQSLNRNLTAKGRASARAAVMQEVGKKIGEDASPERFVSEIRKLKNSGDPVGVFFSGDDLQMVEGLSRVLKATQRASQAALNPPTGVQAVIPMGIMGGAGLASAFGGGVDGFLATVATVGSAGAAARIYESAPVRNILMQLPKVKPGSVEEGALFKRLLEATQAVQTASARQRNQPARAAINTGMTDTR